MVPDYVTFRCSKRDCSSGACNNCSNWSRCRFNKYTYSPEDAQYDYMETLIDSKHSVNLTMTEAKEMPPIIELLLKQGISPYQILQVRPELGISEKTMYTYIENSVLHEIAGISPLDLQQQVSRRISKRRLRNIKRKLTTDTFREEPTATI